MDKITDFSTGLLKSSIARYHLLQRFSVPFSISDVTNLIKALILRSPPPTPPVKTFLSCPHSNWLCQHKAARWRASLHRPRELCEYSVTGGNLATPWQSWHLAVEGEAASCKNRGLLPRLHTASEEQSHLRTTQRNPGHTKQCWTAVLWHIGWNHSLTVTKSRSVLTANT